MKLWPSYPRPVSETETHAQLLRLIAIAIRKQKPEILEDMADKFDAVVAKR